MDFKKTYKELYLPKAIPTIVEVPPVNYLAVRGQGDPNEPEGFYQQAISMLYAVAYALKMSPKNGYRINGFYEYVVPPLEGFWWQSGTHGVDLGRKAAFRWISVLRLPEFVTQNDVDWAVRTVKEKKKLDCSAVELLSINEGLCVQILHIGTFDSEGTSVEQMNAFLSGSEYETDFSATRLHHEIYLSDARRVPAEKRKTVIRHPVKRRAP